ncbi:hypothetical protein MJO28_013911 [Puccinia striiformis f. sp. tritici]|uniref:Uncharacterized protein n=1 Tax=Puccinia striiformis f. sp. tritici TaxID=168172 RepID=A0ACC0DXT4_9BASI|nr:hypothetical protein MJO28_013911 [Puccinia striiformis f. sp. tritici]
MAMERIFQTYAGLAPGATAWSGQSHVPRADMAKTMSAIVRGFLLWRVSNISSAFRHGRFDGGWRQRFFTSATTRSKMARGSTTESLRQIKSQFTLYPDCRALPISLLLTPLTPTIVNQLSQASQPYNRRST